MKRHVAPLVFLGLLAAPAALRAQQPTLDSLRHELALHYLEPAPHMALAKYYHGRGNRLLAFYILEAARRTRFERPQFDAAFRTAFLDRAPFDSSKKAEQALLKQHASDPTAAEVVVKLADIYVSREDWGKAKEFLRKAIKLRPDDFQNVAALAEVQGRAGDPKAAAKTVQDFLEKHPQSREAYQAKIEPLMRKDPEAARKLLREALNRFPKEGEFLFNLSVLLQNDGKLKEAAESFVKAAALAKDSPHVQGWVGRFFLKAKPDEKKALTYYLNAYFLDPHFYDTEYAEGRIRKLNYVFAAATFARLRKEKKGLEELLRDPNPVVAGLAVKALAEEYTPKYRKALLEALGHDDPNVRWQATAALMKKAGPEFDADLKALLKDPELRKRGLAAYLAVKRWGQKGIAQVTPWLKEKAQLLRFDAISALLQEGGAEGRRIVLEHRPHETNPWLKKLLDSVAGK
jgi:tetratricopeptide (TPR) repeat protein